MAKKALLDQIEEVKSRRSNSFITYEIYDELNKLEKLTVSMNKLDEFIADFVPIRLVTFIEVFVRDQVREFVDHGDPYRKRSSDICTNIKFDFLLASSLTGKRFTLGDVVAHSISINGLEQVITIFETILGRKIASELASTKDRWKAEVLQSDNEPIIGDVNAIFKALNELFQVRHIVTHERPAKKPYELSDLRGYVEATAKFISAIEAICLKDRVGNYPMTQRDMNLTAHATAEQAESEMNTLLAKLHQMGEPDDAKLEESQKAWATYCEAEANLHASLVEGGSMWPLIYWSERSSLIIERNARLMWWLEREEGQF